MNARRAALPPATAAAEPVSFAAGAWPRRIRDCPRPKFNALVGGAVVLALLYFGRDVLVPCALAVLLAFLLDPLVTRLRRLGLARGVAVAVAITLTVGALTVASVFAVRQVRSLGQELPAYQSTIKSKLRGLTRITAETPVVGDASKVIDTVSAELETARREAKAAHSPVAAAAQKTAPQRVVLDETPESVWESTKSRVASVAGAAAAAGIVFLILVMVLLQRNDLRDRLISLAGDDLHLTTDAMDEAATRVGRYLATQLLINVLYGVPMAVGLYLIGVPGALMWGLFAALARFVPYVGPVVAATGPLALAAAVDPGWTMLLWTALLVATLELVSNNVIEPWLYGASTGLSPLAVVVAAIFWTALWGPAGLVLSTPLTVCLVVLGRHIPRLAWLEVLLGNSPPMDNATRLHQRLLAGDVEEAIELATQCTSAGGVTEFYSECAVPALRQAVRSYAHAARVEHRHRVNRGMSMLLAELRDEFPPGTPKGGARVLCLGARWEVDTLAAEMLAHALASEGVAALALTTTATADRINLIDLRDVDIVCVSLFSPSPEAHVRFIVRRLRRLDPSVRVLVALWNPPPPLTGPDAASALGVDDVALTLREAVQRVAAPDRGGDAGVGSNDDGDVPGRAGTATTAGSGAAAPCTFGEVAGAEALAELRAHLARCAHHAAEVFDVAVASIAIPAMNLRVRHARKNADPGGEGDRPATQTGEDAMAESVVAAGSTLSSEDLIRDPGFAESPLVRDGGMRFFAGTPLRPGRGEPIGSLCLFDRSPRPLGEGEDDLLDRMAEETIAPFEAVIGVLRGPNPAAAPGEASDVERTVDGSFAVADDGKLATRGGVTTADAGADAAAAEEGGAVGGGVCGNPA